MAPVLTIEQRKWVLKQYWKTENATQVRRNWAQVFNVPAPSRLTIYKLRDKFDATGSILDRPKKGRPVSVTTPENDMQVALHFIDDPNQSQTRSSIELDISRRSLSRIMKKIGLKVYHPRLTHGLLEDDPDRRLQFCEVVANEEREGDGILAKTVWTDEAHFKLSGAVNRHNCVYYSMDNPHLTYETQLNQPGITVWAGISCKGVFGPIFFDSPVNSELYLQMLEDTVMPDLRQEYGDEEFYFQQDGAPPHYGVDVRNFLNRELPNNWIGRRGAIEWPARSPDLTPMDFFFWGVVKDQVLNKNPKLYQK